MPFSDVIGHDRAKTLLRAAIVNNRVAHAYLFHGPDRIGKRLLARRFIQAMTCDTAPGPDGPEACGRCRSCQQFEQQSHPDWCVIEPDRSGATPVIKIEDIRELESRLIYRPLLAPRKFCLIDDAERMNIGAANALLKTLEEPPGHALLILVSSRPYALPATIRSRCQALRLTAPAVSVTAAALTRVRGLSATDANVLASVTEGRLGEALSSDLTSLREQHDTMATVTSPKALRSISTILTTAETLAKGEESAADTLDRLATWIHDVALTQIGAEADRLTHRGHERELQAAAQSADLDRLLALLSEIETFQRNSSRNLNAQLMLEHILLRLRDATVAAPASR